MSGRTDHAVEAERLRDLANGYELANGRSESTDAALVVIGAVANGYAHAQVHATLALVEQQRIANLIAIYGATAEVESGYTSAGVDYGQLSAEIREGLGLS